MRSGLWAARRRGGLQRGAAGETCCVDHRRGIRLACRRSRWPHFARDRAYSQSRSSCPGRPCRRGLQRTRGYGSLQRHRLHERHGLRSSPVLRRQRPHRGGRDGHRVGARSGRHALQPGDGPGRAARQLLCGQHLVGRIGRTRRRPPRGPRRRALPVLSRGGLQAHPHSAGRRGASLHVVHPASRHRWAARRRVLAFRAGGRVRGGPHGALQGDPGSAPGERAPAGEGKAAGHPGLAVLARRAPRADARVRRPLRRADGGAHVAGGPVERPGRADSASTSWPSRGSPTVPTTTTRAR